MLTMALTVFALILSGVVITLVLDIIFDFDNNNQ